MKIFFPEKKQGLEDIIYCIDLIHQYMEGFSKEEFYINWEKQDVLVHRLEI